MKFYAETGINWWFVYQVEYEDNLIVVLRDCGRVHKRDAQLLKPIAAWIEPRRDGFVYINGEKKLYEILTKQSASCTGVTQLAG